MKIVFIQAGGTIDKDYPQKAGAYAFHIGEPAVVRIMHCLNPSFEYEIIPLIKKDSQDLDTNDRLLLLNTCRKIQSKHIIITHGTDTMADTARFLSENKLLDKTIILTGAMKPEKFTDSDAHTHIGIAIGAIQILEPGVYIAMSGLVAHWFKFSRCRVTGKYILNS